MYWIILVGVLWGIFRYDFNNKNRGRDILYHIILFLVIFTSTFANHMGYDCPKYQDAFEQVLPTLNNFSEGFDDFAILRWQLGFAFFASLCKSIVPSFYFFKFVYACVVNITIFSFFRKHTEHLFMAIIFYLLLQGFYFNFEILREALAVAIFIWAYKYIFEKKWLIYYGLCTLALMFHTSAFITFFVPLIMLLKVGSKYATVIMLVLNGVLIGISSQMASVVGDVMALDETIESGFSTYLNSEFHSSNRFSFSSFSTWATIMIDVILSISMLYILPQKGIVKDYFPLMFIAILLVIPAKSFLILFRFTNYFMVFKILFYIEMFKYISKNISVRPYYILFVMVCFLYVGYFFYQKNFTRNDYGYRSIESIYPYRSIF